MQQLAVIGGRQVLKINHHAETCNADVSHSRPSRAAERAGGRVLVLARRIYLAPATSAERHTAARDLLGSRSQLPTVIVHICLYYLLAICRRPPLINAREKRWAGMKMRGYICVGELMQEVAARHLFCLTFAANLSICVELAQYEELFSWGILLEYYRDGICGWSK